MAYVHGTAFGPDDFAMIADNGGTISVSPEDELQTGFDFATLQGVRSVGIDDRVGILSPGKQADIVVLDARAWDLLPLNDAINQAVLAGHPVNVSTVPVAGNVVKCDGRLIGVSESALEDLRARALTVCDRILHTRVSSRV